MEFSQLKNEGRLDIDFDHFGGFLVNLFNKISLQSNHFCEIFISKNKTVRLEVFDKSGMKYTSLLKRDLFRLDDIILKKKINSSIHNEYSMHL